MIYCCVSGAFSQEWGIVTEAERQLQPPWSHPKAGAVVIFDVGFATTETNGLEYRRHTRIKVFDSTEIEKVRNVTISYFEK